MRGLRLQSFLSWEYSRSPGVSVCDGLRGTASLDSAGFREGRQNVPTRLGNLTYIYWSDLCF
jgi:hypothetical protein